MLNEITNINEQLLVTKIVSPEISNHPDGYNTIIFICGTIKRLLLDGVSHPGMTNTLIFLNSNHHWTIQTHGDGISAGYVLQLSDTLMVNPFLNSMRIRNVRKPSSHPIFLSPVEPGLGVRLHSLIDMLEELLTSHLIHRETAILGLVNTFFVYCEDLCADTFVNISHGSKAILVHRYLQLIGIHLTEIQRVGSYAHKMNISSAYLNECAHDVLGKSAKNLIIEQLVMRIRNTLKFTDKPAKEIAYELGFSSPDYFSFFCKKHIGHYPTAYRKVH